MAVVFCNICNNTLDLSKNKISKNIDNGVSVDNNKNESENYIKLIDKLLDETILSNDEIKNIDFITLQNHPHFKEKTPKEKKIISQMINKILVASDKLNDNLNMYFVCDICTNSQKIKEEQLLLTRSKGTQINKEEKTISKWKNMLFSNILPHTREYMCNNKECSTYNGTQRSAKFAREVNSTETWYFCEVCNDVWKISIQ
jgi:DNA-directed RNA polymerase subunit M/transcription elongation factor TFIIS